MTEGRKAETRNKESELKMFCQVSLGGGLWGDQNSEVFGIWYLRDTYNRYVNSGSRGSGRVLLWVHSLSKHLPSTCCVPHSVVSPLGSWCGGQGGPAQSLTNRTYDKTPIQSDKS